MAVPAVQAEDWKPEKPIKLLVGFVAGGSADVLARLIATPLSKKLGQPVIVENVAGAGGNIMAYRLAVAHPDGYTIGIGSAGAMSITYGLDPENTPYRPASFTPITLVTTQPNVVLINKSVPIKALSGLREYVARTPSASYGIAGVGVSNHLMTEAMLQGLGIKMLAVPYKGGSQMISDLLGGHIQLAVDNITSASQLVNEGRAHAIGVTTARRAVQLPDVPTLQEQGLAGFDMVTWQGVFAPAGLPPQVLRAYYVALQDIIRTEDFRSRLTMIGLDPISGMKPDDFSKFVEKDRVQWTATIRASGISIK